MLNRILANDFTKNDLRFDLNRFMKEKGFLKSNLDGYTYIFDIILKAIETKEIPYFNITKKVFADIGKKYNKNVPNINYDVTKAIAYSNLANLYNSEAIAELYWDFLEQIYVKYYPENKEFRVYKRVSYVLKKNGFSSRNLEGYYYILYILFDSIINNTIPHRNINKTYYPKLAEIFNKKISAIDNNIRNAINKSNLKEKNTKLVIAKLFEESFIPSNSKIHETISLVLKKNGFLKNNLDGYNYLFSIFTKALEEDFMPFKNLTTNVYPQMAKKYGNTKENIERSITNAIKESNFKGTRNTIVIAELYNQICEIFYDSNNEEAYIKNVVTLVLKDNGFLKIHLDGYIYILHILSNAIISNTAIYRKMSRVIYPNTAKIFNTNDKCVEMSIRAAIKKSSLCNMSLSEAINKLYIESLNIINMEK